MIDNIRRDKDRWDLNTNIGRKGKLGNGKQRAETWFWFNLEDWIKISQITKDYLYCSLSYLFYAHISDDETYMVDT